MTAPSALLRALLPPGIAVAGVKVGPDPAPLWPEEAAALPRAHPGRRAEFAAGRSAARQALARLGLPAGALPRDARGLPIWPPGVTGSITHAAGWALAAVAARAHIATLGIDIEGCGAALPLEVIATPAEIAALAGRDPVALFSAKEAAYKAQFPLSGRMLGFHDIVVSFDDGGFTARFRTAAPPFAPGDLLHGRQIATSRLVLSAVFLPAAHAQSTVHPQPSPDQQGKRHGSDLFPV